MELNPSAKKKLAVLGLALAGLAIDRGLVFSGGSDASADESTAQQAANPTTPGANPAPAAPKVEVASMLESLRTAITDNEVDRNAFRLPDALTPEPETEASPVQIAQTPQNPPEAQPKAVDLPNFEVTSIIASSTGSPVAVINGVPIRVGQTRDGITLVSVSARVATIRYADQTVNVRLSE